GFTSEDFRRTLQNPTRPQFPLHLHLRFKLDSVYSGLPRPFDKSRNVIREEAFFRTATRTRNRLFINARRWLRRADLIGKHAIVKESEDLVGPLDHGEVNI